MMSKFRCAFRAFIVLITVFLVAGCDTEEVDPIEEEELEQELLFPEFPELINVATGELEIGTRDTIEVAFTSEFIGFNMEYWLDGRPYAPSLVKLNIADLELQNMYNSDSSALLIWGKELFPAGRSLELELEIHWNSGAKVVASVGKKLKLSTLAEGFPLDAIVSTYPVDRQYYFLKGEYPVGFYYMQRLVSDISDITISIRNSEGEEIASPELVKNNEAGRLEYALPEFFNETLYSVELLENGQGIHQVDFRTSKHNTFDEKIESFILNETSRQIHFLWEGLFLHQKVQISSEGFDLAEAGYAVEIVESIDYKYCNGLVQLVFNPSENSWYNNFLYPVLYEPFPADFEPKYAHHPNLGEQGFLALNFRFDEDLHSLENEEIDLGIASKGYQEEFGVSNFLTTLAFWDHRKLKESVQAAYNGQENLPDRIARVISSGYSVPGFGVYKYDMNYRLPDGTITSTHTFEMNLE